MQSKGVLIFSGYNNRAVIAFCRFCKDNNVLFFIIASGSKDPILFSDYKAEVIITRNTRELTIADLAQYKEKIGSDFGISELLILPSTEYLNRFLLGNSESLESFGYRIPLCSLALYEKVSDKYSFTELCKLNNISVPAEYETPGSLKIPFVAKPKKYFSKDKSLIEKPVIVRNEDEYQAFRNANPENFYFQEFIAGKSFYLLFYFSTDGTYSVFSQENLIQQGNGLSIIAARSSDIHLGQVSADYAQLLLREGYRGLIMIEIKLFHDQFFMIEANPRLWGPSQLILDAGMDLFALFALDNGLICEVPRHEYKTGKKYFWSGGIIEDQERKCFPAFHDYEKQTFFEEYAEWCKSDIYLRPDTIPVFMKELKNNHKDLN